MTRKRISKAAIEMDSSGGPERLGTSNIKLISLAKQLYIPNFYCIMVDEFNVINDDEFPLSIIFNSQDSSKNGSHWQSIYIDEHQKIFYCSYGSPIAPDAKEFMMTNVIFSNGLIDKRPILTSDIRTQQFNGDDSCGLKCILLLYLLNNGYKFENK